MGEILDQGLAARRQSYDLLVAKVAGGKSLTASEISAMSRFEKELASAGLDMPTYLDTIEDVEAYTGYKNRTIYAAVQKGELPRLADNRFLLAAVDEWLRGKGKRPQVRLTAGDQDEETGGELPDGAIGTTKFNARTEESRYRHFRARREEIIVRRLEGELISIEDASREWVNRMHEFRTSLLLLNRRVSHKIAEIAKIEARLIDDILDAEAKELLRTLSRKMVIHVDID